MTLVLDSLLVFLLVWVPITQGFLARPFAASMAGSALFSSTDAPLVSQDEACPRSNPMSGRSKGENSNPSGGRRRTRTDSRGYLPRIQKLLYTVFDPQSNNTTDDMEARKRALAQEVASPQHLTFVLSSWSKEDYRISDAGNRSYELLKFLRANPAAHLPNCPNEFVYNVVMDAFARRKQALQAESILQEMLEDPNVTPTLSSFTTVFKGFIHSKKMKDASERCLRILEGDMKNLAERTGIKELAADVGKYNYLVYHFAKRGRPDCAERVLRAQLAHADEELLPSDTTFTTVMSAWAKSDSEEGINRCLVLLQERRRLADRTKNPDQGPDVIAQSIVIDAYARRGKVQEAEDILRGMVAEGKEKTGSGPTLITYNSILNAWSKSDAEDGAERCLQLLDDMKRHAKFDRHLAIERSKNPSPYNIVIDAFARRGRAEEAEQFLRSMLEDQRLRSNTGEDLATVTPKPDVRSFNCVLNAWSKSDADNAPERCLQLVEEMKVQTDLVPDSVTNRTVAVAFAKWNRTEEVESTYRKTIISTRKETRGTKRPSPVIDAESEEH